MRDDEHWQAGAIGKSLLGLECIPKHGVPNASLSFRITGNADSLEAGLLDETRRQYLQGAFILSGRVLGVPGDQQHLLDAMTDQFRQHRAQRFGIVDAPCDQVRCGLKAGGLHGERRFDHLRQRGSRYVRDENLAFGGQQSTKRGQMLFLRRRDLEGGRPHEGDDAFLQRCLVERHEWRSNAA